MKNLKKAFEGWVELEDKKLESLDERINKLQIERTFHVGLRTAYINSLAELEESEKKQDFIDMRTNQDRA